MKYYLIDYENVNAAGLDGIDEISSDSRVVLFYTKNSSKIDLGIFNLLRTTSAELAVIEVHHGKQALDIQLASYVGFLIGTEPADTEYYIVSKDKGYRNIMDFWSDRHIVLCTSLQPGSEVVDEPKPARSSSRSSRGGRSRSSAKGGRSDEKAEPAKDRSQEKTVEAAPAGESKHTGRKGIQTKAEKNTKREKHEKVDLAGASHPAKQDVKAEEPAEAKHSEAPDTATSKADSPSEKAPEVNAFAEAAALAAAMAAARNGSDSSNAILTTKGSDAPKDTPEEEPKEESKQEPKEEPKKASRKKSAKKTAKESSKEATKEATKKAAKSKDSSKKESTKKDSTKKDDSKDTPKDEAKDAPKQKTSELRNEVNTEIQKILSKEGFSGDIINATASFVSKNIGKDGYRQLIYRGIIKDHGQKQGLAIYRLIKGVL